MANRYLSSEKGLFWAPFILFSLLFISCSKSYSDYLVSNYQNGDTLYFIKEQSGWHGKKQKASFSFDITYQTSKDSLILNFSLVAPEKLDLKMLSLSKNDLHLSSKTKKIFVEPENDDIQYRYSSSFLFSKFDSLLTLSETQPKVKLITKGDTVFLDIKRKKWNRQREILKKNFVIFKANR